MKAVAPIRGTNGSGISYLIWALVLLFSTLPAFSASFDCTKARSPTERMICANAQLSLLDETLAATYAKGLEQIEVPNELKRDQRAWLATTRHACRTADCLALAYERRIDELKDEISQKNRVPPPASTSLTKSEISACRSVVEASNQGKLRDLEDPEPGRTLTEPEFQAIFGSDYFPEAGMSYSLIDLDDDGKSDHFAIFTDWPMILQHSISKLTRPGANTRELTDPANDNQRLLRIAKRYYLLTESLSHGYLPDSRDKTQLGALWKWRKSGKLEKLCDFQSLPPLIALSPKSVHPVCIAAEQGNITKVAFVQDHTIMEVTGPYPGHHLQMVAGRASIDLDHDNRIDSVVRVNLTIDQYRGCDTVYLAMTDDKGTALRQSPVNQLLLSGFGHWCGASMTLITHAGQAYIDGQMPMGDRTIHQIDKDQATLLCTFNARTVHTMTPASPVDGQ